MARGESNADQSLELSKATIEFTLKYKPMFGKRFDFRANLLRRCEIEFTPRQTYSFIASAMFSTKFHEAFVNVFRQPLRAHHLHLFSSINSFVLLPSLLKRALATVAASHHPRALVKNAPTITTAATTALSIASSRTLLSANV